MLIIKCYHFGFHLSVSAILTRKADCLRKSFCSKLMPPSRQRNGTMNIIRSSNLSIHGVQIILFNHLVHLCVCVCVCMSCGHITFIAVRRKPQKSCTKVKPIGLVEWKSVNNCKQNWTPNSHIRNSILATHSHMTLTHFVVHGGGERNNITTKLVTNVRIQWLAYNFHFNWNQTRGVRVRSWNYNSRTVLHRIKYFIKSSFVYFWNDARPTIWLDLAENFLLEFTR